MSTVAERAARAQARPVSWRRTPVGRLTRRLPFLFLVLIILVYIGFPFYWALRSAFTPDSELFNTPVKYFPDSPTLSNFREVLSTSDFTRALLNSAIVAGSVTLIAIAFGSLAGYALGRYQFRGRQAALYLMLSMTIFPQIAILGALYTMINGLHVHLSFFSFTTPHIYNTAKAAVIWSFFPAKAASVDRSYLTSGLTTALGHALMFSVAVPLPNFCPVFGRKPKTPLVRAPFSSLT